MRTPLTGGGAKNPYDGCTLMNVCPYYPTDSPASAVYTQNIHGILYS